MIKLCLLLIVVAVILLFSCTTTTSATYSDTNFSEVITSNIREEIIAQLQKLQKNKAKELMEKSMSELVEMMEQGGYGDLVVESDSTLDSVFDRLVQQETFLKKQLVQMQQFIDALKVKYETLVAKHEEELRKLIEANELLDDYKQEIEELERLEIEQEEQLESYRLQLLEHQEREAILKQQADEALQAYEESKNVKSVTETHLASELETLKRAVQLIEKHSGSDSTDRQFDIKTLYEFISKKDPNDELRTVNKKSGGASVLSLKHDHAAVLFDMGLDNSYEY